MMKKEATTYNQGHPMRSQHGTAVSTAFFFFLLQLLPHAVAQSTNNNSYTPYNGNFRPSMTVTIIVLSVACVLIGVVSFYLRRCAHEIHIDGGRSIRLARTRPTPRGLDASVIETFPTFLYSVVKGLKIGKGVLECAVCLNEFEDDETLRLLPKCNHVFHPECIDAWLSSHTTCPVCRAELVPHEPSQVSPAPETAQVQTTEDEENPHGHVPDISETSRQVSIRVTDDDDQIRFPIQNRPVRSKSMIKGTAGRFPRSHSTGHSIVRQGDGFERFTLKLPEDVRKQILNGKLYRTTSCVGPKTTSRWSSFRNGIVRSGSSNRGRSNNQSGRLDWVAKSDRWLHRATSFFWRSNSVRLSKRGEGSVSSKIDGMGQSSSTRPPV